jgi:indolepyruvate ferredoxin oxidoreductase, alpha subunit
MSVTMDKQLLLLGDEAIAQAALDAGITGAYAYPGTPSTELLEYIQKAPDAAQRGVHSMWSVNEKTAMEEALGMSYAGRRTIVAMKHVGLNVASDAFVNSAITGVNGGLIVVVADDPSMHSSQNEQDSRYYAKFAHLPLFEPSDQQEAYDMVFDALDFSEQLKLPVVMRITTRLAHSRAEVQRKPFRGENKMSYPTDDRQFILLPANARRNYTALLEKQKDLLSASEKSQFNQYIQGSDKSIGVITTGIAFNYLREAFGENQCPYPIVKITQYPVPKSMIQKLFNECESVLVVEEGAPMVEEMLVGLLDHDNKIKGRLDGALPRTGELSPDAVGKSLGLDMTPVFPVPNVVTIRPPSLCKGCPHIDSFVAMKEVLDAAEGSRLFGDIGCYTLGALPPYNAINTCVDMGASVTMAKGASDAGVRPAVAVIGDSTFMHSGMTGLIDCVMENTPMTLVILDNEAVAMTGGQKSHATNRVLKIVEGLDVDKKHLRVLNPVRKYQDENMAVLKEEFEYEGVSVVIFQRECIQTIYKNKN